MFYIQINTALLDNRVEITKDFLSPDKLSRDKRYPADFKVVLQFQNYCDLCSSHNDDQIASSCVKKCDEKLKACQDYHTKIHKVLQGYERLQVDHSRQKMGISEKNGAQCLITEMVKLNLVRKLSLLQDQILLPKMSKEVQQDK